jgi:two-component system, sensor histidine kinase
VRSATDIGSPRLAAASDKRRSLEDITTRASMRVRTAQATVTAPIVALAAAAVVITMRGRVDAVQMYVWAGLISTAMIGRTILCHALSRRIDTASTTDLVRYERYLFISAVLNALAAGSAFYLVARNGDLTVRLVITLLCCFYGIGTLVNASSHIVSFIVVSAIIFGLGIAFWLGCYSNDVPHYEVAVGFLAIQLLVITFGRENNRQFRESLRIRTENVALVESLAAEKKIVEQALQEVRIASESKSRFLAAASHDLRQPLHALTMFLGTLSFHVTSDDARRILRRIKDTAVVLEEQFNSLLDLSKFDAGAVQAQSAPFRIDRLVERVVDEFRPEAEGKQLQLRVDAVPVVANSDAMLIERVLRNLVGNAVKYTAAGDVTVQITRHREDILVEVRDTGRGIPEDEQKRIFEEYVQLANPARQRRHGVGLGLAIVRRIDQLLGLQLFVKSSIGNGSVFGFHLPITEQQAATTLVEPIIADAASFRTKSTIWILDDDLDVVEALQEQLLVWGAKVQAFSSPEDLLDRLRTADERPDWILSDDMLGPDLSGLETAQLLAAEFGIVNVCLITGNTEPQRLAQLRSSGIPLIIKPAQPEALMRVIRDSPAAA